MSAPDHDEAQRLLTLDKAKVLLLDPSAGEEDALKDRLIDVGFREIAECGQLDELVEKLGSEQPDLLFIDLDEDREAACRTMQDIRTKKLEVDNPFIVIIALTAKPDKDIVQAALGAGADDMIVKPVNANSLRQRVTRQIDDRKDFIATDDYVGPDRRPDDRDPSDQNLVAINVPNTLRHHVTGDETAALTDDRIQDTLRSLSAQKFWHLSQKIGRIAAEAEAAIQTNPDFPLLGECLESVSATLTEIEEIMGDQDFKSVREIVASTREALASVEQAGDSLRPNHFALLKVHGQSIGAVLKESDEVAGVLVTELERAVNVVNRRKPEAAPEPAPTEAEPPDMAAAIDPYGAGGAAEDPQEPQADGKLPLKVRFLAWWEGVDPSEIMAQRGGD